MPDLNAFKLDLNNLEQKIATPDVDRRWVLIAQDLRQRVIPGWESAFSFVRHHGLIVCGGMVWRPLHEPSKAANDVDLIASDQLALRAAIAAIPSYGGDTKLSKTKFGGDRVTWSRPTPGSLDIWVIAPELLMTFVAQLVEGKRTLWTPSGIVLDLDPPGVVPKADFIEPYNITDPLDR